MEGIEQLAVIWTQRKQIFLANIFSKIPVYRGAAVVEHGVGLHGGGGAAGVVGRVSAADVARIPTLKSPKQVR